MKNQETINNNSVNTVHDSHLAPNFLPALLYFNKLITNSTTQEDPPLRSDSTYAPSCFTKRKKDIPKNSESIKKHIVVLKEKEKENEREYQALRVIAKDNKSKSHLNKYSTRKSRIKQQIIESEKDLKILELAATIEEMKQENEYLRQKNQELISFNSFLLFSNYLQGSNVTQNNSESSSLEPQKYVT